MTTVAIVYHSGFGHTKALAEAVAKGAQAVPGAKVSLVPVAEAEARAAELDAADAIIFGSPTYMGGVSAEFAKFKDWTSKRWMEGTWRNKLAAGFTSSASCETIVFGLVLDASSRLLFAAICCSFS